MKKGTLYLVPTPIGNMKDITIRAIEILKDVHRIYAEDTRTSGVLLHHHGIDTPLFSYHKFNERKRCDEIILQLNQGESVAIISDAGSPGISDPSNIIVREVIAENLPLCPLPGPTALIPAITAAGFNSEQFIMLGFLPAKNKEVLLLLKPLVYLPYPMVFYESPHRLFETLQTLKDFLGNRPVCIAREISKIYETWYRHTLDFYLQHPNEIILKGEFVIVIGPDKQSMEISDESILEKAENLGDEISLSDKAKILSKELNIGKNKIYRILLDSQNP